MVDALSWWLLLSLFGLAALPVTLRLLRFLPSRGWALSRHIGLLLTGYLFWLLCSLGFVENTPAGILLALMLIGGVSAVIWVRHNGELRAALRRILPAVVASEALFALAFFGFCLFRSYVPEIAATEKPMEFGFINAILRSRNFPPNDPWLAGYSISYYYFGYVLIAMLIKLSAVPSSVGFNLGLAVSFALTASACMSVVMDLVLAARSRRDVIDQRQPGHADWRAGILHGLNGVLFVSLLGNLEGVFEFIRARGWGSEALWRFLDIRNLGTTTPSRMWYPDDPWFWWRATRLLHDRDASGASQEVISEFPFFSYLLGDNHPHVLALPFVVLAVALACNVLFGWYAQRRNQAPVTGNTAGLLRRLWPGGPLELIVYGLLLGALIFLNTWDYPIYLALFILALLAGRLSARRARIFEWLLSALEAGLTLLLLGVVLYLPFLLTFRSQAGGFGLVRVKTQWQQFAIMFGPFLVVNLGCLAGALFRALRGRERGSRSLVRVTWIGAAAGLLALGCLGMGWWVSATALLSAGAAVMLLDWQMSANDSSEPDLQAASRLMQWFMMLIGFALVLAVEFIYLRDVFDSRMNTVFKFYYQAWVLLGLAAALGVYDLVERCKQAAGIARAARAAGLAVIALLVAGCALYSVMAVFNRTSGFSALPTLDGMQFLSRASPDEYAAIRWLQANAPDGSVMVEAPGGQYSEYNRLSAYTGVPTLLGWGGHELQWRGSYEVPASREPHIETIYSSPEVIYTRELLRRYGVTYVVLGPHERTKYPGAVTAEAKFDQFMTRAFQQGELIIYTWAD